MNYELSRYLESSVHLMQPTPTLTLTPLTMYKGVRCVYGNAVSSEKQSS